MSNLTNAFIRGHIMFIIIFFLMAMAVFLVNGETWPNAPKYSTACTPTL